MPFNGQGLFQRVYNWVQDAANGILVRADRMDTEMDGMATALSTCITKDGQTQPVANLPMNGYRHLNVAPAQNGNEYATYSQSQSSSSQYAGGAGGTGAAYTIAPSPVVATNITGATYKFLATTANTVTAPTLQVGSAPAAVLVRPDGSALSVGEIANGTLYQVVFDGTNYRISSIYTQNPNFTTTNTTGNSTTGGSSTAASFIPTGSAAPSNGVYLPSANTPAMAQNGVLRQQWSATGSTLNGTDGSDAVFVLNKPGSGSQNTIFVLQRAGSELARVQADAGGNLTVRTTSAAASTYVQSGNGNGITVSNTGVSSSLGVTAPSFVPTGAAGGVGMYVFARASGQSSDFGGTQAGSSLTPAAQDGTTSGTGTLSGTWQCQGYGPSGKTTLWIRIA